MSNEKLFREAQKQLRLARRNVGKAWKEVQEMKLMLARAQRKQPLDIKST